MSYLVPATDDIQVNSITKNEQDDARIAALPNGGFVVVWESLNAKGDRNDIYQQVYDADGTPVGRNVRLNTDRSYTNYNPVVEVLSDGSWVVVWGEYDREDNVQEVKARMIRADGVPRAEEFTVNEFTYGDQDWPDVSATEDGGFIVVWDSFHVWTANGVDYETLEIRSREFDSSGEEVETDKSLLYSMYNSRFPQVTTLENGEILVVWQYPEYDSNGNRTSSRNEGLVLTKEVYFEGHSSALLLGEDFSGIFSVEALEDDRFVVAGWTVVDGVNQVVVQVYENGPYRFETISEPVYTKVSGLDVYEPRLAATADGGFVLTYTVDTIPGYADDGGQEDTYIQRYDADGKKAGAPVRVSEISAPGQFQFDSDITVLEGGQIVSVWEGFPGDGSSGVYIRMFEPHLVGTTGRDILRGSAADDNISGRGGNDRLSGSSGDDNIHGGRGRDNLRGQNGNDRLEGDGGDDRLAGGKGQDVLIGGRGNDTLDGGRGDDLLKGGAGADHFVFSTGKDKIAKFNDGTDTLVLDKFALGIEQLNAAEILETHGRMAGDNLAILDFGGGDILKIRGVSDLSSLADDIIFT
ncbi:calcium-binding protein [Leisingera sp. MMG026]|uniref:calcium-binding protein n=1 Tax=Leisingera sp. MMG026 TaxID=2909982 RepID=UPI001F28D5DE|nr:calcium-binding protein [Leisingera sp. MMG026]MCF6432205.1 hypothetical protein [Leisingera sp. MMG026]